MYRLLAGIADHFHFRNGQVSMLFILFGDAAILDGLLSVFLHVVQFRIRYNAGRGHRVADVICQGDFIASYLPSAAILSIEEKFLRAVALSEAASHVTHAPFVLSESERTKTKNYAQKQIELHKSPFKCTAEMTETEYQAVCEEKTGDPLNLGIIDSQGSGICKKGFLCFSTSVEKTRKTGSRDRLSPTILYPQASDPAV